MSVFVLEEQSIKNLSVFLLEAFGILQSDSIFVIYDGKNKYPAIFADITEYAENKELHRLNTKKSEI